MFDYQIVYRDFVPLNTVKLKKLFMIPSNFTIEEVLKLPSLTLEELKEYIYNLDISSLQKELEILKNELDFLQDELDDPQI